MLSVFNNSANALIDKVANKSCTQVNTSQCHINTNVPANLLHQRLGHPNKNVLKCILFTLSSCSPMSILALCDACQYGKLHQFSFYSIDIKTTVPLELIHTDL